jgi:hypothetical protein
MDTTPTNTKIKRKVKMYMIYSRLLSLSLDFIYIT